MVHSPRGGGFRRLIGQGDGRTTAILFRQVATPNYELRSFLKTCRRMNFEPVILTYHHDRMSCHNVFERALVAPAFVEKINRLGEPVWRRRSIENIEAVDKIPLCDIEVAGKTLPNLHALLLSAVLPGAAFRIVEGSSWFGNYPRGARDYYVDLFLGLSGPTVLFEDFVSDAEDAQFFKDIVQPAFRSALDILGHPPHVMRLNPGKRVVSPLWYAYPDHYRAHLAALGVSL